MSKILKNQTASIVVIQDIGQQVPASGQLTIDPSDYDKYAGSADVLAKITSGDLRLNDGIEDLDLANSLAFVLHPDLAENIRYKVTGSDTIDLQTAVENAGESSIFGSQFYENTASAETSTNSAVTYLTKCTFTTGTLPAGNYMLMWRLKWRAANADRGIQVQSNRDATELTNCIFFSGSTSERSCEAMFSYIPSQSSGSYTYTLKFRVGIGSTTVYGSDAQLILWRIS